METKGTKRRRRWADIVVIVAAMYALMASTWVPPEFYSGGDAAEVERSEWLLAAYVAGGVLGLAGILLSFRSAGLARALVLLGALAYLSGLFALHELTALAVLSVGVPGLAMLVAAPFVGPMPTPQEEEEAPS